MADKTPTEELAEQVKDELYRWNGSIRIGVVVRDDPTTDYFEDVSDWLEAHFLMSEDVGEFLKKLDDDFLRELNTTTNAPHVRTKGEIRGPVDWKRTIEYRTRTNYADSTRFVCRERNRTFETDKNIVLKQLLENLREIGTDLGLPEDTVVLDIEEGGEIEGTNLWEFAEGESEVDYEQNVTVPLEDNVYLDKIELDSQEPTDRTVDEVTKAREEMYQRAAELLREYRKIRSGNLSQEKIEEYLKSGIILPENDYTLFELFWIFQLIPSADNVNFRYPTSDSKIAEWEYGGSRYDIYHDKGEFEDLIYHNKGEFEDLQFRKPEVGDPVDVSERLKNDNEKTRTFLEYAHATEQTIQTDPLGVDQSEEQNKRPDIVLTKTKDDELRRIFIGEIKYSRHKETVRSGARELVRYVLMAHWNGPEGEGDIPKLLKENENGKPKVGETGAPIRAGLFFDGGVDINEDKLHDYFEVYTYDDNLDDDFGFENVL